MEKIWEDCQEKVKNIQKDLRKIEESIYYKENLQKQQEEQR